MGITTIVYKCDVCGREIQIAQNKKGLDTVGACVITNYCKGHLYPIGVKENVLQIPIPPPEKTGLEDWRQRKALHNFQQHTAQKVWTINTDLGSIASVQTFVYINEILTEMTPVSIEYPSVFQVIITWDVPYAGVAQCIARTTTSYSKESFEQPIVNDAYLPISINGELTIAVATPASVPVSIQINFLDPRTLLPSFSSILHFVAPPSFLSPWKQTNTAFVRTQLLSVHTFNIKELISTNTIANGSSFYFSLVGTTPLPYRSYYALLAKEPYTAEDKDPNHTIDLATVDHTADLPLGTQIDGVLYWLQSSFRLCYPPIKKFS